jgi:hypothetical protein
MDELTNVIIETLEHIEGDGALIHKRNHYLNIIRLTQKQLERSREHGNQDEINKYLRWRYDFVTEAKAWLCSIAHT